MPTQKPPVHPAQFSPEVIDVLRPLLVGEARVFDPFAGMGTRLGALCDELDVPFTGIDIEDWPGHDPRVTVSDATRMGSYPWPQRFTVVTSPTYVNKRLGDYANGPGPNTKVEGRRDYGISLGRSLHFNNTARFTGKPSRAETYWALHSTAITQWEHRALVNVDGPISDSWQELLEDHGYRVKDVHTVITRRYGGLANAEKRADNEVVIDARR